MNDNLFKEKYKKLNKEQRLAVDTIDGPLMVVAGPGTGKTTVLTLRIANILRKTDTLASSILALTFTDAGAKVMKLKLREIIGSRADDLKVFTFHAFASKIISEYPDHFPHISHFDQISDIESEEIIRNILKDARFGKLRPFGENDFYVFKIIKAISDSKKEAWEPHILKKFAQEEIKRVENDKESISTRGVTKGGMKGDALKRIERCQRTILFSEVYELYEEQKRSEKKMDFDDLLHELLLAMREDKLLLQLLQEKFLYILVDEHQDTNDLQNLIISLLASFFDNPNIFIVGDEKQAIYRFQGASVENFLGLQKIWKKMKVIQLKSNYRSHQKILDAVFPMIENNYKDKEYKKLRVSLKSETNIKERPIDVIYCGNSETMYQSLIEKLKYLEKNEKDAKIAVIVRKNREVDHVLSLCLESGIKVSAERGADIFSHPTGMLFWSVLMYLNDPSDLESLSFSISSGLWNIDFQKRAEIISLIKSGNARIEKIIPELESLRDEITKSGPINFLILLAGHSGFLNFVSYDPLSAEIWRSIIDLSKSIAERKGILSSKDLIKEILAYKKSAETKSVKILAGNVESNIIIMTAHSSKGLEFDYVFLPNPTEETWLTSVRGEVFVFPREKEDTDNIKDIRRLFYVAITRAKNHVEIFVPNEDYSGKLLSPLRFIDELDRKSVNIINLPKKSISPSNITLSGLWLKRKQEILEFSKRIILENGLSVTALNHYLTCPREFFYKSILKLPEAPSPSSEKGIAMHKALSLIWKEKERSEKVIKKIIDSTVTKYMDKSLLPIYEKEVLLEELLSDSSKVAKELVPFFSFSGKTYTEIWEDMNYITKYDKNTLSIRLHGQLDAILINQDSLDVYDYKTRQAIKAEKIKDKNSDYVKYFRQLVFYKMLLSSNQKYNDKKISLKLLFIRPDKYGKCQAVEVEVAKEDISNLEGEINNLIYDVWSGEYLKRDCGEKDCKYCKFFKTIHS